MSQECTTSHPVTAEMFFHGLLAALAASGKDTLAASYAQLHRAFRRVLEGVRNSALADLVEIDDVQSDYDALYGVTPWFDRALTRAQRDLFLTFPNPSYDRIHILLDSEEAESILASLPGEVRDELPRLAREFYQVCTE